VKNENRRRNFRFNAQRSTLNVQRPTKQELGGKITEHTVESEIRPDAGLIWCQLDKSFFVIATGEEESLGVLIRIPRFVGEQ